MAQVRKGVHINKWTTGAKNIVVNGRPGLVKSLDQNPEIFRLKEAQGFFYVARRHFDKEAWFSPTPEANAEYLFSIMHREFKPYRQYMDCILTPWNERAQRPHENAVVHALAVRRFAQLAHEEGYKVGGPNFSVGNPEPEQMNLWAETLSQLDYFVLHEYWAALGPMCRFDRPYWVGRWKRLLDALPAASRKPIIFGECGIDNQLIGRSVDRAGWRDAEVSGATYAQQLQEFYDSLDPALVLGIAVFNSGDHDNQLWKSFELETCTEFTDWLKAASATNPAPQPQPETPQPVETGDKPVLFNTNPANKAIYPPGALNQLAQEKSWEFVSDEVTQNGPTGANIVQATMVDRSQQPNKFYLVTWTPGFPKAAYLPLS